MKDLSSLKDFPDSVANIPKLNTDPCMRRNIIAQLVIGIIISAAFVMAYYGSLLDIKYRIEPVPGISNSAIEATCGIVNRLSVLFALLAIVLIANSLWLLLKMKK